MHFLIQELFTITIKNHSEYGIVTFSLLYSNVLSPCRVKGLLSISRGKAENLRTPCVEPVRKVQPVGRTGTKISGGYTGPVQRYVVPVHIHTSRDVTNFLNFPSKKTHIISLPYRSDWNQERFNPCCSCIYRFSHIHRN